MRADTEMHMVIAAIMTREGNYATHQTYCNYNRFCKFNFTLNDPIMLHSTVVVYFVQNRQHIYQGETVINGLGISRNRVNMWTFKKHVKIIISNNFRLMLRQK